MNKEVAIWYGGIEQGDLNEMEGIFLHRIGYSLVTTEEEIIAYRSLLVSPEFLGIATYTQTYPLTTIKNNPPQCEVEEKIAIRSTITA